MRCHDMGKELLLRMTNGTIRVDIERLVMGPELGTELYTFQATYLFVTINNYDAIFGVLWLGGFKAVRQL